MLKKLRAISGLGLLSFVAVAPAGGQTLYNNGATITIASGGTLYVRGDMVNAASSTIANNGMLRTTGSATNNGTINATGTLLLEGTTAQTLSGSTPVATGAVIVNNPAGVTLNTPLRVAGAATFTSGVINAPSAASPVIFTTTGSVSGTPTNASHVNGYVQKEGTGAFTYPVGNATNYQPVGINLSANPAGMTARYVAGDAGSAPYTANGSDTTPLLYYNEGEYWDLTPVSTANGTVTLYYDGYNNPGTAIPTDLRVAHKTGGQWRNEGGTANGGAVTSNSISSWSPFTIGSISLASPLPVLLISFTGREAGPANRLEWQTAHEDAGATFTVERSADGRLFESIGTQAGKGGNSSYVLLDEHPLTPIGYYRLKTTDAAGDYTYSSMVALQRSTRTGGGLAIWPVPATTAVTIACDDASLHGTQAVIRDMQGRVVCRFRMEATQRVDASSWAAGIYQLQTEDGAVLRIVKQ